MGNHKKKIRQPKQKRSIEKRKRIIEAGYQLFNEKGYYHTNTAEIAKQAGVSTGIVYSYFRNKKDIFMEVIEEYYKAISTPMYELINKVQQPMNISDVVRGLINTITTSHTLTKSVHDEIASLSKTDDEIGRLYYKLEKEMQHKITAIMHELNIQPTNVNEKVHIIINLVESIVHESVYQKQTDLNYEVIIDEIVNIIVNLLSE